MLIAQQWEICLFEGHFGGAKFENWMDFYFQIKSRVGRGTQVVDVIIRGNRVCLISSALRSRWCHFIGLLENPASEDDSAEPEVEVELRRMLSEAQNAIGYCYYIHELCFIPGKGPFLVFIRAKGFD